MAITYSSTLTEITRVADPLSATGGELASVGGNATLTLSNGYTVTSRAEIFSNSSTMYGQVYDDNGVAVGVEHRFASAITGPGGGVFDFKMVDLGNGFFAESATSDAYNDSNDSLSVSVYNSVTGTYVSGFGVYRSGGEVDFYSLPGGGTAFTYSFQARTGQGDPFLAHWGFIGEDGRVVSANIPGTLITNVMEQVAIGDSHIAIYDIVEDGSTGADSVQLTVYNADNSVAFNASLAVSDGSDILTPDMTFLGGNLLAFTYEIDGRSGSFARIYDVGGNIVSDYTFDPSFGTVVEVGLADVVGGKSTFVALFSDGMTRQFSFELGALVGDGADDVFFGTSGDDIMQGNGGNDTFKFSGGNDVFDGGSGTDTIDFSNATSGQIVSLRDTRADGGNEAAISIEIGIGSDFADVMVGSSNADTLLGGDGNDYIYWSTGADVIDGGAGSDTYVLFGRPVNGGPVTQASTGAFETLVDLAGERLSFAHYNDPSLNPSTIVIQNIENFTGSDSWDTILGTTGSNTLSGGGGKDTIYGGTFGLDVLTGGTGEDVFVVAPRAYAYEPIIHNVTNNTTRITDFEIGVDKIDLGGQSGTYAAFVRSRAETGIAGITDDGNGNAVLEISMSTNGSVLTDRIIIEGVAASDLSTSDFILPAVSPNGSYEIINNVVTGSSSNDVIDLSGSSVGYTGIIGNGGDDTITGTEFNDSIGGGGVYLSYLNSDDNGNDIIHGGGGNDTILGDYGDDELFGDAGNDDIYGGGGIDNMYGGDGDDTINFELTDIQGGATIQGGAGYDTAYNRQGFESGPASAAPISFDMTANGFERYFGSAGAETIDGRGSTADLVINTNGASAGRIIGYEPDPNVPYVDTVYGGSGNDTITNAHRVYAGAGDDVVTAFGNDYDNIRGGEGQDTLYINTVDGLDLVNMEFETVILKSTHSTVTLDATGISHAIRLVGGGSHDSLIGGGLADTLEGNDGTDTLNGMGGDDILIGGDSDDTINGGDGVDVAVFAGNSADYVISESNNGLVTVDHNGAEGTDTLTSVEILRFADGDLDLRATAPSFTEAADVASGTFRSETMNGLGGNDVIRGLAGNDTIIGGAGNDSIYGGAGGDFLFGGIGDDYLYFDAADASSGSLSGGSGYDTAIAENLYGTAIDIRSFGASGIERIFLTHQNDVVDGSDSTANLTVYGFGGSDTILTGSGDDYIFFDHQDLSGAGGIRANAGYDWLVNNSSSSDSGTYTINMTTFQAEGYYGTADADVIEIITAAGTSASVTIYGNGGADQITGGSGDDYIYVNSDTASYVGGAGFDYLIYNTFDGSGLTVDLTATGFEGAVGRGGNDSFDASGNTVSATLYGAGGNDILIGGSATDYLYGDSGDDTYTGNGNTDYFLHDNTFGRDTVTDFAIGTDVMIIRTAGVASMADILFTQDGADAILTMGANSIRLTGVTAANLSAGDFIFAPTSAEPLESGPEADAQESKADIADPVMDDFADLDASIDDTAIVASEDMSADLYEDYVLGHEAEAWVIDVYGVSYL